MTKPWHKKSALFALLDLSRMRKTRVHGFRPPLRSQRGCPGTQGRDELPETMAIKACPP